MNIINSSLFIGRFQPPHEGHIEIITNLLMEGKSVVIGIRDTEFSKENPYSMKDRWDMFAQVFKTEGKKVKIISIPDIDEVAYGRDVGYLIRRIQTDEEIEKISATKIRSEKTYHPIFWLTGQSGSGKTTIANKFKNKYGGVVLDGDEMRQSISLNAGFSKEDREEHNLRVARLAQVLSKDNAVFVSVIAPFAKTREMITEMIDPVWIYIKRDLPLDKNKPYEIPIDPDFTIDVDKHPDILPNFTKLLK